MDTGEHALPVLEVVQRGEPPARDDMLEEPPRGMVCRDPRGQDESGAALGVDELEARLGEHRIGIHVAGPGQRKTASCPNELARRLGFALGGLETFEKRLLGGRGVVAVQLADQAIAGGFVSRAGNLGRPCRKELLFLELDPFPRWIAKHRVESLVLHDLGEPKVPMEKVMPARQIAGPACDADQSEFGGIPLLDVFRQGHGLESPPCFGREVCP